MRYDEDEGSTLVVRIATALECPTDDFVNYKKIVVDFTGVELLSSAMIGRLVLVNKAAKASGADLRRRNAGPSVVEVLRVTRLSKVFKKDDDDLGDTGSPVFA